MLFCETPGRVAARYFKNIFLSMTPLKSIIVAISSLYMRSVCHRNLCHTPYYQQWTPNYFYAQSLVNWHKRICFKFTLCM